MIFYGVSVDTNNKLDGFFSIDRGAFRCAAAGGLNSAIAHLVIARGTGRDNHVTQWSVHAIEERTGISRPNAAKAIKDLLDRGVWKRIREGQHPIYEAVSGNQISCGPFVAAEQAAIEAIRAGASIPYGCAEAVTALKARGLIREVDDGRRKEFKLDDKAIAALCEPFTIWIPNTVVDGAAGEVPPVELVRQTRSLPALRLLIELYGVQFLPNFGGVPRDLLKTVFDRAKIGEQGSFVVWGFKVKHTEASHELGRPFLSGRRTAIEGGTKDAAWQEVFWPAVSVIEELGLVERVGMLVDGDDPEAEVIHPYGIRMGEPSERELADAAQTTAAAMVTEGQFEWAATQGYDYLVPVRRHIANVTLVEVFRLKYRPHTAATAAWHAQMQETTAEYIARYRALLGDAAVGRRAA